MEKKDVSILTKQQHKTSHFKQTKLAVYLFLLDELDVPKANGGKDG